MKSILAAVLLAAALPAPAILIRADRGDAEYLEMASKYKTSVALPVAGGGEGVLIAPRWVLTSGRVGKALQSTKGARVEIDGRKYDIVQVVVHPAWTPAYRSSSLALVYLKEPVRSIEPTPLYRQSDEAGGAVVIVGHGETGRIGDKSLQSDGKKRGAINTIDRVAPRMITLTLKAGDAASDLQGAAAPGDEGGPAYLETAGSVFVVGIAAGTEDTNHNGVIDAGDAQDYVRVSTFIQWIDDATRKAAEEELADKLGGAGGS